MLVQNGITIWRFHDNWHDHHPDGIVYGVLKKLNWLKYNSTGEKTFSIPPSSLKQIIDYLKTSLGIDHVRVIGDLSASCEKITFLPGAWAGQNQIKKIELDNPDLLLWVSCTSGKPENLSGMQDYWARKPLWLSLVIQ